MPTFSLKDAPIIGPVYNAISGLFSSNNTKSKPKKVNKITYKDFKDKDGYYKRKYSDGRVAVLDYDNNGKPVKNRYIGGTTQQVRDAYWEQAPIMRHATDSIANRYGINPKILRNRLNHEGFTDTMIKMHNASVTGGYKDDRDSETYFTLNRPSLNGFAQYGLDDVYNYITDGSVKPINENWYDGTATNEKGRTVRFASGERNKDSMGLVAATLKAMRDKAAKDFPGASRQFLDEAAGVYYNRGMTGGKNYMRKKKK